MKSFVAALVAVCCLTVECGGKEPVYRLPTSVLPTQYKLSIYTDRLGFKFSGKVIIEILVKEDTKNITLHAKNLTVNSVELSGDQANSKIPSEFRLEPKKDLLLIQSSRLLTSGDQYLLSIDFEGDLRIVKENDTEDCECGYQRVKTGPSDTDWMSAAAFQMVYAREAFPCWDEPAFKAKFLITLIHPSTHKAVSNMPIKKSEPSDKQGWIVDHFENTPPMSSYLVVFHLTQWDYREIKADDGRPLRLWANHSDLSRTHRHLEYARRALTWLQNYTGIPDPMPKIDFMVVPSFFPGALETWGDISFSPDELLDHIPIENEAEEMDTLVHELVHYWFGNLVTPKWWDSLWLSEGAATFFAALAVDELSPGKSYLNKGLFECQYTTFVYNSKVKDKPVNPQIHYMEDLHDFPSNVYFHGFSLYYMLYQTLGPEHLRAGVHRYLTTSKYDTATPRKLYDALKYQWKGKELTELMSEWTYQAGIPMVTVTRSHGQITLSQEQFILSTRKNNESYTAEKLKAKKWWIPVTFTTQKKKDFENAQPKFWFKDTTAFSDPAPATDWILFNIKSAGLYIVNYDDETFKLILESIGSPGHDGIPTVMRAKFGMDYAFLASKNETDLKKVMKLYESLYNEEEDVVWKTALFSFRKLTQRLRGTPSGDILMKQMHRLTTHRLNKEGEEKVLRSESGHSVCLYGLPGCGKRPLQLFHQWTTEPKPDTFNRIPRDIRRAVYCKAMRTLRVGDWEFLKERALRATDVAHRGDMFAALGCTNEYQNLYKLLDDQLKSPSMTKLDWTHLLNGLVLYNTDVDKVLGYLQRALTTLQPEITSDLGLNGRILKNLAERVVEPSHLGQFKNIVSFANPMEDLEGLTQDIEGQIQWREFNKNTLIYL